jgi:hypothetical protein
LRAKPQLREAAGLRATVPEEAEMQQWFDKDESKPGKDTGEQKGCRIRREYRGPTVKRHKVSSVVASGGTLPPPDGGGTFMT